MSLLDLTYPASYQISLLASEPIQAKFAGWKLLFRSCLAQPSTRSYPLPPRYCALPVLSGETGKVGILWRVRDSYRMRLLLQQGKVIEEYCHAARMMPSSQSLGLLYYLVLAHLNQQSMQLKCIHAVHSFRTPGQCGRSPQDPSIAFLGA